jgi:hypothetical protein
MWEMYLVVLITTHRDITHKHLSISYGEGPTEGISERGITKLEKGDLFR